MNKENLRRISEAIKKKGDEIQSILPSLPNHPTRQAQAHLYREIKLRFGVYVAELGDHRFDEVMRMIDLCCEHAADPDIKKYLTWIVAETPRATLEDFINES